MRSQRSVEVRNDLLAAHHQDQPTSASGIGTQLAAGRRCDDERPVLRDCSHAPDHEVRCADQLADLAALGRAVHLEDPRPDGVVPAGLRQLGVQADVLEGLRLPRMDLAALRDHREDQIAGLGARVDDDCLDVVRNEDLGDAGDPGLRDRRDRLLGHEIDAPVVADATIPPIGRRPDLVVGSCNVIETPWRAAPIRA